MRPVPRLHERHLVSPDARFNTSPYRRSSFDDQVLIASRAPRIENGIDPRAGASFMKIEFGGRSVDYQATPTQTHGFACEQYKATNRNETNQQELSSWCLGFATFLLYRGSDRPALRVSQQQGASPLFSRQSDEPARHNRAITRLRSVAE